MSEDRSCEYRETDIFILKWKSQYSQHEVFLYLGSGVTVARHSLPYTAFLPDEAEPGLHELMSCHESTGERIPYRPREGILCMRICVRPLY